MASTSVGLENLLRTMFGSFSPCPVTMQTTFSSLSTSPILTSFLKPAIDAALAYQDVADYLILDTQATDIAGIGASGKTHDWTVSRQIVRQVRIPVILAGGLSPENVAQAIRAVRPWGVDSLSHTNRSLPGGRFRKDIERVRHM